MNSFYGGQSGRTYHIVKRYKSINQMTTEFAKGGSYTEVNYGQYVLISTLNKNNDENGLLFRRGFDYNDDVSLSTKPTREEIEINDQSSQPVINPETNQPKKKYYNNIYDQNENFIGIRFDEDRYQIDLDTYFSHVGNGAIYVGRIVGADGKAPNIGLLKWEVAEGRQDSYSQLNSDSDADGYEGLNDNDDPIYNDTVQAATFSELDIDGNVTEIKLALKIPKPTFIISAQSVDPYGDTPRSHYDEASGETDEDIDITVIREGNVATGKVLGYSNLIHEHTQTGKNAGHPFYHNYDIAIPKGIKGDAVTGIKVQKAVVNQSDPINNSQPWFRGDDLLDSYGEDIVNDDEYITFDITKYDVKATNDVTYHQGRLPFRVIKTILSNVRENRLYQPIVEIEGSLVNNPVQPELGDLYEISSLNKTYAICTRAGEFHIEDFDNLQPGGAVENGITHAWWRCVHMQHPAPETLTVDYKAGESENIITGFIDYLYLDNQGNLFARYANGENTNLGFIDTIDTITENDGKFTITFISNNSQDFYVNSIVDVQRVGDQLYFLYSDDNFRREYITNHSEGDYKYLSYSGLNPQSRFVEGEYDDDINDTFIYIRLNSSIGGGYHIQGEFNYEDIIWIGNANDPFHNMKYLGKLSDISYDLRNLINTDDPEDISGSLHYDGLIEDLQALSSDQLQNIYKEGYVINIITPIIGEEKNVEFFAYNFNHAEDSVTTELDRNQVLASFNDRLAKLEEKENYQEDETYILLTRLKEYLEETEEEDDSVYKNGIYSNWYGLQQINETSISLARVYIIDDEEDDAPKNYGSNLALNDNGLWFVTFSGHDEEE